MAYTDFGPPRRSRRRRNVVVLILLLAVIGVLTLAVRYRTERRESIDYLSTAKEVAVQHAAMADRLGTLFQELGVEDRPAIILRLESLAAESHDYRMQLEDIAVTRPVAEVSGFMAVAVVSWDDAVAAIDDAIVAVLDAEEGDLSGDEALWSAFQLLRVGDRAYAGVIAGIAELDPEIVPAAFPEVSYAGGRYAALYDAPVIAERLRQMPTLSESRDVQLTAATVPEPVNEGAAGIWTIPASDTLVLEVTVSNTGNVTAELVTVVVTLQKANSSEAIPPLGQVIPAIPPGKSEVLAFENLDVEPGNVYTITAEASFEDGPDAVDDNTWTLSFERNAE